MKYKCKEFQSFVYELIDEMLPENELTELKNHLKTCHECKSFYNNEMSFSSLIKQTLDNKLSFVPFKPIIHCIHLPITIKPKNKLLMFLKRAFYLNRPVLPVLMVTLIIIMLLSSFWFFNSSGFLAPENLKTSLQINKQPLLRNNINYNDDCLIGDSFCDWKHKRLHVFVSGFGLNTKDFIINKKENTKVFLEDIES